MNDPVGPDDHAWLARFSLDDPPPGFAEDPYPFYAALRRHRPVHEMAPGRLLLTRHADVLKILQSPQAGADRLAELGPRLGVGSPVYEHHRHALPFSAEPLHSRLRLRVRRLLDGHAVLRLQSGLVSRIDELLHAMAARPAPDLVADFAAKVPVEAIGDLLAIPRPLREPLQRWSAAIRAPLDDEPTPERLAAANAAVTDFRACLRDLLAERSRAPADPAHPDALTRLAHGDPGDPPLAEDEVVHGCMFLLAAGHAATTQLIANAVHQLMTRRGVWRKLFDEPWLLPGAIDELARLESPLPFAVRRLTAPLVLHGQEWPAGTEMTLALGAANRDPEVFAAPDRLDLSRTDPAQLAFGAGDHACIGERLARLQARLAIGALIAHHPGLALAGTPEREPNLRLRGFRCMPVSLR